MNFHVGWFASVSTILTIESRLYKQLLLRDGMCSSDVVKSQRSGVESDPRDSVRGQGWTEEGGVRRLCWGPDSCAKLARCKIWDGMRV